MNSFPIRRMQLPGDGSSMSPSAEPLTKRRKSGPAGLLFPDGNLSIGGAVFALICTSVGSGIVAVPRALSIAGWGAGLLMLALCAAASTLSLHCLFECMRAQPTAASYQSLVRLALPRSAVIAVEISTGVLLLGAIGTSLLLAMHVLRSAEMFAGVSPCSPDMLSLGLLIAALPLCLPRNFAALEWLNLVNFVARLLVVAIICGASFYVIGHHRWKLWEHEFPTLKISAVTSLSSALASFPLMLYMFFCQISAPQLFSELKVRHRSHASLAGFTASLLSFALYGAVGLLGYGAFGAGTEGDILVQLANVHAADSVMLLGQALFGMVLLSSTPLVLTPLRTMAVGWLFGDDTRVEKLEMSTHVAVTAVLLSLALLVARLVPWVDVLMGILGATCVTFLGFTVPGMLVLHSPNGAVSKIYGWALIGGGVGCTPLCLGVLIRQLLENSF
eukprot:gnl/TRDRNA2_/TRDRNA2_201634_c0_seq1.p1 gnl/TRDRNA2_/TRDRNA2_201634_c0~~gnl/TRDRNA2_/TRDRNA2_201634_c0_seq1.p1  ORF type:complete len:446 (-),score=46.50 gnl/TRDRNA2_/TRDRNA2_201634_c0_seq1:69-1406(-)